MSVFVFEKLTVRHQTKKRLRIAYKTKYPQITGEIESYIGTFEWARNVRINAEASSIVIEYSGADIAEILHRLRYIKLEHIELVNNKSEFSQEKILPLVKPLMALAATPLLPD